MSYNNNVPQGNQTIASTTDPIRNNFAFLDSSINQEHNFDVTDATKTYHKQASMPNRATPGALPAGTNGMYYVTGGVAAFYDGTREYVLNTWQNVASGTYTATSGSTFNTILVLPANVQGIIILTDIANLAGQIGTFITDGTKCYAFSSRMKINNVTGDVYPIELNNNSGTLALQGRYYDSSYAGPYIYKVFYRNS